MKMDNIVRNLRVLWRADSIIAETKLRQFAARSGLLAVAALITVFGLIMLDMAVYFALDPIWGRVWAALVVGIANIILAAVLVFAALRIQPGREIELAGEIHQVAIDALAAEAKSAEAEIANLTRLVKHPFDSALPGLIVPLASIVMKALRKTEKK